MPTAARLFAALGLAAVGVLAAEAHRGLMPPHAVWGWESAVFAGLGLLTGWSVLGPRVGRGYGLAMATGLTAAVTMLIAASFVFAVHEMVQRALMRRYGDAWEATLAVLEIMLEHAARMGDVRFIATLVLGGLAAGLIAEAAGRLWR